MKTARRTQPTDPASLTYVNLALANDNPDQICMAMYALLHAAERTFHDRNDVYGLVLVMTTRHVMYSRPRTTRLTILHTFFSEIRDRLELYDARKLFQAFSVFLDRYREITPNEWPCFLVHRAHRGHLTECAA